MDSEQEALLIKALEQMSPAEMMEFIMHSDLLDQYCPSARADRPKHTSFAREETPKEFDVEAWLAETDETMNDQRGET